MNAIKEAVTTELRKTAIESIYYVAFGKVMKQELAKKLGVTVEEVDRVMNATALEMCDQINALFPKVQK